MIGVLRLGHRPGRDDRITTHVGLTARAFGANKFILSSEDERPIKTIKDVNKRWGGEFTASNNKNWKKTIKKWKKKDSIIIHLTMYGEPIKKKINEIQNKNKDILIIIGAKKVPAEIYELSDYNVAIGNQPHSEVAAIGVFLDRYNDQNTLQKNYKDANIKVIPQKEGKKTINKNKLD